MTVTSFAAPLDLAALDRDDLPLVGGKAANLGAMLRAGLPVPAGFCVPAPVYATMTRDLGPTIADQLAGLDVADAFALDAAARAIRAAIEALTLPPELVAGIEAAYHQLSVDGQPARVAVRSSATAEDLPGASFAGQQDTFLNVGGSEQLVDAVRRCWSSLWTPRAIAYRQRNGFAHDAVAIAVVVQRMVEAQAAGVLFTADPVSGNRTRMVVNGAWGLGEAVVGGLVAPDGWILGRDGAVLDAVLGAKEQMVIYDDRGGTVERDVPLPLRAQPCLTPEQLHGLHQLGRAAEAHFGEPQDIEWALADNELCLLQSRPITTLFPLPTPRPIDGELHVYLSANGLQGIIEPLTPMGISFFRSMVRAIQAGFGLPMTTADGTSRLVEAAGRLYVDGTAALRHPLGRQIIQLPFRAADPTAARLFPTVFADPRLALHPIGSTQLALTVLRVLRRVWPLPRRIAFALRRPDAARRKADALITDRIARLEALIARPMSARERLGLVMVLPVVAGTIILPRYAALVGPAVGTSLLTEALARRWQLPLEHVFALRQGLRNNPTSEMDLALWKLSQRIKADPAARDQLAQLDNNELAQRYRDGSLPPDMQRGLAEWLARYGHRAIREIDIGMPRWAESPAYILGALNNYLMQDDPALAPDRRFDTMERTADEARAALIAAAREQPGGWLKARVLAFATSRMRSLLGAREAPKFWGVRMMALTRRLIAEIGKELAASGAIDTADDVFFLQLDEVDAALDGDRLALRERVAQRRAAYAHELQRTQLPRIITSEGEIVALRPGAESGDELVGIGVSPGEYTGPVRVIRDPHGAQLAPGEILVAPSTDPAWTPLFLTAGGLVMEAGGMLSHGSVVAREYGIPAVVGVGGATTALHSGEIVSIDGTLGTIERVDRRAATATD